MKPIRYSKQDVCSASRLLESQQKVEVTKIAQPANGFKGKYFGKISSYKLQILTRPSTLNSISITYLLQPIKPRETRRVNSIFERSRQTFQLVPHQVESCYGGAH